ncbi:MAG: hypothetical protein WA766_11800 [Candidatus Acidiferrales bacterium]
MDILEAFQLLLLCLLGIATMTAMPIATVQFNGALFSYHNINVTLTDFDFGTIREAIRI